MNEDEGLVLTPKEFASMQEQIDNAPVKDMEALARLARDVYLTVNHHTAIVRAVEGVIGTCAKGGKMVTAGESVDACREHHSAWERDEHCEQFWIAYDLYHSGAAWAVGKHIADPNFPFKKKEQ